MTVSAASRRRSLYREVNERIRAAHEEFGVDGARYELFCECRREGCALHVSVPPDVYADARAHLHRFVVSPGHEVPGSEQIVVADAGYLVVVNGDTRATA